ncbi:MAG: DNA polymerase III subunit epsilon [Rhizobiales bacterium]|nr:DNA polymerase III subunit epsilon [Hyphomicrobiales bacterium]
MREIIFDTETTGFDPDNGDRIVEIGCVEMIDQRLTGATFHVYINPERDMPQSAFEVHGLSADFLKNHAVFASIADAFLAFIADDSVLVAHNASFDMKFINAELARLSYPAIAAGRVVDTLVLARRKHPMGPNSLDALCARYGVDNSKREKHGALLDAELLADVYIELLGGRQRGLDFTSHSADEKEIRPGQRDPAKQRPSPLESRLSESDIAAHRAFVDRLGGNALWQQIWKQAGGR